MTLCIIHSVIVLTEHDLFTGVHYIYTLGTRICSLDAGLATKSSLPSNIDDKWVLKENKAHV